MHFLLSGCILGSALAHGLLFFPIIFEAEEQEVQEVTLSVLNTPEPPSATGKAEPEKENKDQEQSPASEDKSNQTETKKATKSNGRGKGSASTVLVWPANSSDLLSLAQAGGITILAVSDMDAFSQTGDPSHISWSWTIDNEGRFRKQSVPSPLPQGTPWQLPIQRYRELAPPGINTLIALVPEHIMSQLPSNTGGEKPRRVRIHHSGNGISLAAIH